MRAYSEKKKYVMLSADAEPTVYLVPDVVADNLTSYCKEFRRWLEKKKISMWNEEDFIAYIDRRFPESPCECVETFGDEFWENGWAVPEKYKGCNWYNF